MHIYSSMRAIAKIGPMGCPSIVNGDTAARCYDYDRCYCSCCYCCCDDCRHCRVVAPMIAQLAEGLARMQVVSGSNPRLGELGVSPPRRRRRPACACVFAVPASLTTTASLAPTRLRHLITSLPHNSSLLEGRVEKTTKNNIPSLWRDKASGLQSTTQGTQSGPSRNSNILSLLLRLDVCRIYYY